MASFELESQAKSTEKNKGNKWKRIITIACLVFIFLGLSVGAFAGGAVIGYTKMPRPVVGSSSGSLTERNLQVMYDTLKELDVILKKHKIQYFLIGGTLVGAMRNKPPGVLKWDDDADIGILAEDERRLQDLLNSPEFQKDWQFVPVDFFGYKVHLRRYESAKEGLIDHFMDIFVYYHKPQFKHPSNPNVTYFLNEKGHGMWPREGFEHASDMIPTVPCAFYDLTLQCPRNATKFLKIVYGDNIMTHAVKFNHRSATHEPFDLYGHVAAGDLLPIFTKDMLQRLDFKKSEL